MNTIKKNKINTLCSKHNSWKKIFLSWLEYDDNLNIKLLESIFLNYLKYKNLLKTTINPSTEKRSLQESINIKLCVLVLFENKIKKTLKKEQNIQFIKSLKTKKYRHLFNKETEKEIHSILDTDISYHSLKEQFFSQIIKYESDKEFLKELKQYKIQNKNWNKEYIVNQINNHESLRIIESKENSLMVQVYGFNGAQHIGSIAWCITERRNLFDDYTDNFKRQYFHFDFSQPPQGNQSLVGFTIDCKGEIVDMYLKDNSVADKKFKSNFKFEASYKTIINYIKGLTNYNIALKLICKYKIEEMLHLYLDKDDIDATRAFESLFENNINIKFIDLFLKHKKAKSINVSDRIIDITLEYNFDSVISFFNIEKKEVEVEEKEKVQREVYNHHDGMNFWLKLIEKDEFNISILSKEDNKLILKMNEKSDFKILNQINNCKASQPYLYEYSMDLASYVLFINFNKDFAHKKSIMLLTVDLYGTINEISLNDGHTKYSATKYGSKLEKKYSNILKIDMDKVILENAILKLDGIISDELYYICKYNLEELFFTYVEDGKFDEIFKDKEYKKEVYLAFSWAVAMASVSIVKKMLESININNLIRYNNNALYVAYKYRRYDIVRLLLGNRHFCENITIKDINKRINKVDRQKFIDKMLLYVDKN